MNCKNIINAFSEELARCEQKVNEMPPSDDKARVTRICDFIRREIVLIDARGEKGLSYDALERIDNFMGTLKSVLPKKE
jgi:hypothetical protein